MEIAHLIEIAGVGIVTAVSVRAMFGVYSFASRRMEFVIQERRDVAKYRKYAAGTLEKSDLLHLGAEQPWIGKRKFRVAARVHEKPGPGYLLVLSGALRWGPGSSLPARSVPDI